MRKYKVGVIGATGMVGQRFLSLLTQHPYFEVKVLAASARSKGKRYGDLMLDKWIMETSIDFYKDMIVYDAQNDVQEIVKQVDFVFCAVAMKKEEVIELEEMYAKLECPVISNNSALRKHSDVPMIIPEINSEHIKVIDTQRKRLNTKKGFVAVKSNCSLQSYLPAIFPLLKYEVEKVLVCTYQAISGAGLTFNTFPEIIDNVIPYIANEEEKTNQEPLKILGNIEDGLIVNNKNIDVTSQCVRVPVSDGHLACVFVKCKQPVSLEEVKKTWLEFDPKLNLPSSPNKVLHYFEELNRPQPKLDRNLDKGMAISLGRLRADSQYNFKFVALSHNTIRGAAGGAILMAELLCQRGYIS